MKIDPNAPADGGMTVRAKIAAMMTQALLGQHETEECESGARNLNPVYSGPDRGWLVIRAVRIADELIDELNKEIVL